MSMRCCTASKGAGVKTEGIRGGITFLCAGGLVAGLHIRAFHEQQY